MRGKGFWLCAVAAATVAGCAGGPDGSTGSERADSLIPRERLLLAAAEIGLPPQDFHPESLPAAGGPGATALTRYCGQCHAPPAPTFHSATDWPSVVRRMWLRMDHLPAQLAVAVPNEGERHTLLEYLTANALPVAASLPPGTGRETFRQVCSQCHALPDPRMHLASDWPTVFLRMRQNMERMEVAPPSQEQTTALLTYLESTTYR